MGTTNANKTPDQAAAFARMEVCSSGLCALQALSALASVEDSVEREPLHDFSGFTVPQYMIQAFREATV